MRTTGIQSQNKRKHNGMLTNTGVPIYIYTYVHTYESFPALSMLSTQTHKYKCAESLVGMRFQSIVHIENLNVLLLNFNTSP